jgi:hypothetical protein
MDPNDPGQAPDAPPPYGAPPASPYGAPPDSPYGAPPASPYGEPPPPPYGAPPPAWGVPDSPYGAPPPAWGVPAPATAARKGLPRRLIAAVIAIIVVVVIGAVALAVLRSDDGKVQFSKTAYDQSKTTCHMDNAITTANAGDTIYMIAAFKDTLDAGQSFTLTVTKDGQKSGDSTPTSLPTRFNCYIEQAGINPSDPGVYKFTFSKDGKTEAEGTLTVK